MKKAFVLLVLIAIAQSLIAQSNFYLYQQDKNKPEYTPVRTIIDDGLNGITIEYNFDGVYMNDAQVDGVNYTRLNIKDFSHLMEVGKPSLPSHNDIIAIPVGATAQIEIISYDVTEVNDVLAFPALQAAADYVGAPEPSFEIDEVFYKMDTKYPTKIAEINTINYYRNIPLAIVQIHPVQYNPKEKTLFVYSNIKYKVSFSQSNEFLKGTSIN